MLSPGMIANILLLIVACYIFFRSLGLLTDPVSPGRLKSSKLRTIGHAVGLFIWFSVGAFAMSSGLTGLLSRLLLAIQ